MRDGYIYILRMFLVSAVVLVLQLSVINRIAPLSPVPDLIFVLMLILVVDRDPVTAVIIGFLLGFLQDLGNAAFLGMNSLGNSVAAYMVSRIGKDYLPDNIFFRGMLFFAAFLVKDIIALNIVESFSPLAVLSGFFRYTLLSALFTSILAALIWKVLEISFERVVYPGGKY
ncbi:MAG: rod shape-determining protein MreD [Candidatus Latescibacteria bacterium]|nr:rod shape-determining protein MreD [bacterium]MBD3424254.1 rod shape-determining protein MreD [Candidatus Latescibacterota bacterium]